MAHILPDQPRTWGYPLASPPVACIHGVPYVQQCHACGWACPTCQRSYAPWVRECNYRHDEDPEPHGGAQPGDFAPIPPVPVFTAMSRLVVPDMMTRPGGSLHACAGREWDEVWTGLQCRHGGWDSENPDRMYIEFRLTPAENTP